jgi:glycosyltransferase involved in cell wall biosynthesis
MIYVCFPLGTTHGWGVASRMIVQELARRTAVSFLPSDPLGPKTVEDEFQYALFASLIPPGVDPLKPSEGFPVNGPVLRAIPAVDVRVAPKLRGPRNVGYMFFENDVVVAKRGHETLSEFDVIVTGSTWCAEVLRSAGYTNVVPIIQGIEPRVFNPLFAEKQYFPQRFVIFSGGKLELRKGQDIVIRAVQVMQQRHKDVWLFNCWYNWWGTAASLAGSRFIRVSDFTGDYREMINKLLAMNGVDVSRVMTFGPRVNVLMPRIYRNSDVGLFPNRCEGGTNLIMCEYMACGKPVIAAYNTGQCDILTDENSKPIRKHRPFPISDGGELAANWLEPDLDETIAHLEWAYQNRDQLKRLGTRAGEDLSKLTWGDCAEKFLRVLTSAPAPAGAAT